jgi:hypothetical protein
MAKDALLQLHTGTTEIVTASGNGTAINVGGGAATPKAFQAELRVGGAITGTTPTLDGVIEQSATSGGSYATIGTFAQVLPASVPAEGGGDTARQIISVVATLPYVRWRKVVAGTGSPTFNACSCYLVPPTGGTAVG